MKNISEGVDPRPLVEETFIPVGGSNNQRGQEDAENLGYTAELKKELSALEIFGVGFTIMSVTPSVSSSMTNLVTAGGVGMTWGWLVPCFFILSVATAMSEMASAMPTAGGSYWWTHAFAPEGWKDYFSFLCGYSDTLGMIAGYGSINYGAAQQVLAAVSVGSGYVASSGVTYAVFLAICALQCLLGLLPTRFVGKFQTVSIFVNLAAAMIILIALPVGMRRKGLDLNSGNFVLGDRSNLTNYPYGMAFLLTWIAPAWAVSGQDACVHLAEDASNAGTSIPYGIIMSIMSVSFLGFAILAVLAACIDPSFEGLQQLVSAPIPLAEIINRALNKQWAVGLLALLAALQILMGLNNIIGTSRLVYAFARDEAFPFSRYLKMTSKNQLPLNSFFVAVMIAILIGLLILAGTTAANAIFSLTCSALYLAWCMPIFFYAFSNKRLSPPGPFYLGHFLSKLNATIASVYGILIILGLSMLPRNIPVNDSSQMNYSCVLCGVVWGGSTLFFWLDARKWYHGPKNILEKDYFRCEIIEAEDWTNQVHQTKRKLKRTSEITLR